MTLVSVLLILRVSMPAPLRSLDEDARRPSPGRALRAQPAALRAIAVMAAVNFVLALVAVALLPLALDSWSSDAAGYGLATGVLGFAAFGAPLLRRLGRSPSTSIVWGLSLVGAGLLLVVPVPTLGWALAPLALAGAAAVSVEAGATAVLQENMHDEVRATVLGINDTVIIAAALVGSLVAPVAVELLGGAVLLGGLAGVVVVVAWWAAPDRRAAADHALATVGGTRLEAHEPAAFPATTEADRVARRAAVRADRLRGLERRGRVVPLVVPLVVRQRVPERTVEPAEVRRPG